MKVCFVGAYNQEFNVTNVADSPAGNQVQSKIIEEMTRFYGADSVCTLSSNPKRSWPYGPLVVRSKSQQNGISVGYLNISIIKATHFSFRLFRYLNMNNIDIMVKYNISFSEALILRILKCLNKKLFICIIIQDINYPQRGIKIIHGLFEWCAVKLCNGFDFTVPITSAIINDFGLPISKAFVFNGGITRQTEAIMKQGYLRQQGLPKEEFAVFAGAIERYNGIDLLIEEWIRSNITIKLHIFGKGNLSDIVSSAAKVSDNIIYHGFVSEEEVTRWQALSSFNICLRFSKDIADNYFFPSKFFNIVAAQGLVVVNNFTNFPEDLKSFCSIVNDDLRNLSLVLNNRDIEQEINNYNERLKWINKNCQWSYVVEECNRRYINNR